MDLTRRHLLQLLSAASVLACTPVARRYFIIGDPTRRLWVPQRFAIAAQDSDLRNIYGMPLSSLQEFWTAKQAEIYTALKEFAAQQGYYTPLNRVSAEKWNFGNNAGLAEEFER